MKVTGKYKTGGGRPYGSDEGDVFDGFLVRTGNGDNHSLILRLEGIIQDRDARIGELEYVERERRHQIADAERMIDHLGAQIDDLAACIGEDFPEEIGAGDPVHGESAVEVAVRILHRHNGVLPFEEAVKDLSPRGKLILTLLAALSTKPPFGSDHLQVCYDAMVERSVEYGAELPEFAADVQYEQAIGMVAAELSED